MSLPIRQKKLAGIEESLKRPIGTKTPPWTPDWLPGGPKPPRRSPGEIGPYGGPPSPSIPGETEARGRRDSPAAPRRRGTPRRWCWGSRGRGIQPSRARMRCLMPSRFSLEGFRRGVARAWLGGEAGSRSAPRRPGGRVDHMIS